LVDVGHHHHPEGIKDIDIDFGCGDDNGSSSECGGGGFKSDEVDDEALELDLESETCHVYEEDEQGRKHMNPKKTYKVSAVETFVGVKINLDDKYYNEQASTAYQKRAKKLMKYTHHIEEVVCLHSHDDAEEDEKADGKANFDD